MEFFKLFENLGALLTLHAKLIQINFLGINVFVTLVTRCQMLVVFLSVRLTTVTMVEVVLKSMISLSAFVRKTGFYKVYKGVTIR